MSTLDKLIPSKSQFWDIQVPWWKLCKFLMLFSKPQVSCYFPNLQILHHSLMSWKITPLYFFRSIITYFLGRNKSRCKFLRLLSARIKIPQILISFETANQFFFKFFFNLQCHETQPLCTFFSWNFIYFQQKEQIWWNWKSEIWHFDGLLLSK